MIEVKVKVKVSLNYKLKQDSRSKLNLFYQYHFAKFWIEFHHNLNLNQILQSTLPNQAHLDPNKTQLNP